MQREARFVDFIKEPIAGYSDAQIGAAVRDIHRDCGAMLERLFGLKPIESAAEGAEIQVSEGFDPARIRLVGNVTGQPPFRASFATMAGKPRAANCPRGLAASGRLSSFRPAELELR